MKNNQEDLLMFTSHWNRRWPLSKADVLSQFERKACETGFERDDGSPSLVGQSGALIKIERFVDRVVRTSQPAYQIGWGSVGSVLVQETPIGRRLRVVLPFCNKFGPSHHYSEQVTAFLHACWLMGYVYHVDLAGLPTSPAMIGSGDAEVLNSVVERIRMSSLEPWYARVPIDRSWEARQRARKVADYTADILRYYSRTMIVRVDLGYLMGARIGLTIDQVMAHLDQLRYLVDWHPIFDSLVGYAWCMEQGERDGYHIHCIFYFDGSRECRDGHKGFEIGRLWQNGITGGAGHFENCNAHKDRYSRLGIGMIHRDNAEQCLTAIDVLQYIAKDDGQHLRMKPHGRRVFGTGRAPDIGSKLGRPAPMPVWSWLLAPM